MSNVDNTSDADKPISTATQAALDGKAASAHTHTAAAVGLGNVNNTADADKPISTATQTALDAKADLVAGKIPEAQLPAVAITDVFTVASQAAMLALTAERGDVAVRSDLNKTFALAAAPASTLANWVELRTPTDAVLSVAGRTGAVTLTAADVGLGNVNNTSDANKPVSTAQQTAMDVISRGAYNTVSGGVIDLSLASGKYVLTVNGNVTVSFSNAHATYREAILVEVVYTSGTVTWPASIAWKGGTPPTLTAGKKTWVTLYRSSAGTQYVPAVSHQV